MKVIPEGSKRTEAGRVKQCNRERKYKIKLWIKQETIQQVTNTGQETRKLKSNRITHKN